ncbi:MAG: tryptophan synthase subunit alpha [bacterium]|nr:tryptophan synthase subunit alpha [bacterium]
MSSTMTMTGLDAIAAMFARAKAKGRAAFLPFFTVGFPTYAESIDILAAMSAEDVDGFEIGIPFSDPLADGPTIQAASQVALDNGIGVADGLRAVRDLRARGVHQPILLFSYLNPVLAYGVEKFVLEAKASGAQGFIIPDLPPEEKHLLSVCEREGMALVFFVAPTSQPERIEYVAAQATGFIYVISVTGITGARRELPPDLTDFIARVRSLTDKPLVLGFGISTPQQARQMNGLVDGFIVASALIRERQQKDAQAVRILAASLRWALDGAEPNS